MPYDPSRSESRWQAAWEQAGSFTAMRDDRPKYYGHAPYRDRLL